MAMALGRKTKTRVENLIAWLLAVGFVGLVVAGAWLVVQSV